MEDRDILPRMEFAIEVARRAGALTLDFFLSDRLAATEKADGSPVTEADRQVERFLRDTIRRGFPEDGVLGEEFGEIDGASGFRWIIDPIDGTVSFVHGVPLYGTLVAVEVGGTSVVGVIHVPALGETVYAARGHGAWHAVRDRAPRRARVSSIDSLDRSLMCTTGFEYFARAGMGDSFGRLCGRFGTVRGWSDCYAHVLVATGRADVVLEPSINPWDVAAVQPIIEEAGGRYTDFDGNATIFTPTGVSSNGLLHDAALAAVAEALGRG